MAKTFFTIREVGTIVDDHVHYVNSTLNAASVFAQFADSRFFLEAKPNGYGSLDISWEAPTLEISNTLLPVDVSLRWSLAGEPQTIEEGAELVNNGPAANRLTVSSFRTDITDIDTEIDVQGKWVYLSLFLRHAALDDDTDVYVTDIEYYELVASVAVLMPYEYGSIDDLWQRIPLFLREQDTNDDLYNYLKIFAWDVDYVRTIVDYLMVQRDPQLSSSYALQQMMEELGTLITTVELGATRARNYMQNILRLRLSKGTEAGITEAIQAIAGARVHIDTALQEIHVHPQRTNLLRDPRISKGVSFVGATSPSWYGVHSVGGSVTLGIPYLVFEGTAASVPFTGDINFIPTTGGGAGASVGFSPTQELTNVHPTDPATIWLCGKFLVPFTTADTLYFQINTNKTTFYESYFQEINMMYTTGTATGASAGSADVKTLADGNKYLAISMADATLAEEGYVIIKFVLPAGEVMSITSMILENGYLGDYFDGNTNIGGWLNDATTAIDNRPDYSWHNNATLGSAYAYEPFETFAIYTSDRWRTNYTLSNIYQNLIPVNCIENYSIVFDWLPAYQKAPIQYTLPVTYP